MIWVLLLLGAAAGGFVNGLAGFGTALFALGFWLQIMPPTQAVAIVAAISVSTGLQGLWAVRHALRESAPRLLRFVAPALIGVPLGVAALASLDAEVLKLLIAAFMLLYGGYFALRRDLPTLPRSFPVLDGIVGFLGGFLGGAAALSGALPTMWSALQPWTKLETRAVLQLFNVIVLGATTVALALQGAYRGETLTRFAIALPVAVAAAQLGVVLFRRLSQEQFRRLLIALMLASGIILILQRLL